MHDKQLLPALDGCVDGVDFPEEEKHGLLAVPGLETAGLRALRNSVYACGGVIGVVRSSSFLITSNIPGAGLLGSSEGNVAVDGVFKVGSVGLGDRGVLMVGTVGVGVDEDDDTGDADDDVDPSTVDESGDEASDESAVDMMPCTFFPSIEPWYQLKGLRSNDGSACGGQRVSRGSKQRKAGWLCWLS